MTAGDPLWDGRALFPASAPTVLRGDLGDTLPIVIAELLAGDPAQPVQYHYLGNLAQIPYAPLDPGELIRPDAGVPPVEPDVGQPEDAGSPADAGPPADAGEDHDANPTDPDAAVAPPPPRADGSVSPDPKKPDGAVTYPPESDQSCHVEPTAAGGVVITCPDGSRGEIGAGGGDSGGCGVALAADRGAAPWALALLALLAIRSRRARG